MIVYKKGPYQVLKVSDGFIIQNINKDWEEGHTHLHSRKRAIDMVLFATKLKVPNHYDTRCLYSLYRIAEDEKYKERLLQLIETKRNKGTNGTKDFYYNPRKGGTSLGYH